MAKGEMLDAGRIKLSGNQSAPAVADEGRGLPWK